MNYILQMELSASKSKTFWIIKSLVFIFAGTLSAGGQIFPNSPEPWRAEYEISLKGFEFSHPGTVISEDELAIIRKRILYDIEPQKTAFKQLLKEADATLAFMPNAPQAPELPSGYEDSDGIGMYTNVDGTFENIRFENEIAVSNLELPQLHFKVSSMNEIVSSTPANTATPFLYLERTETKKVYFQNNNFTYLDTIFNHDELFNIQELKVFINIDPGK
jgi:hypothetical protein